MSEKGSDSAAPAIEGTTPDGSYINAIRKGDPKIDSKLGANNYLIWADDMKLLLQTKMMWKIVNETIPAPNHTTHSKDYRE